MPTDPVYQSVLDLVRAHMDDFPKAWVDEAFTLAFVNSRQRLVVQHLIDCEIPTLRVRTGAITIPANTTAIDRTTTPKLPVLLDIPMSIWEAPSGGSASDYRPLAGPFPHSPAFDQRDDTLGSWNWQNGQVQFVGCATDRDVTIDYVGDLADLTIAGPNTAFLLPTCVDIIAALVASAIAISRGQPTLAQALGMFMPDRTISGEAGFALSTLVNVQKAPEQGPVSRRPMITRYRRPW